MSVHHFIIAVVGTDSRSFVIQEKWGVSLIMGLNKGNDGMCEVKKAFDPFGKEDNEIVLITDLGDIIAEVEQDLTLLFKVDGSLNGWRQQRRLGLFHAVLSW